MKSLGRAFAGSVAGVGFPAPVWERPQQEVGTCVLFLSPVPLLSHPPGPGAKEQAHRSDGSPRLCLWSPGQSSASA